MQAQTDREHQTAATSQCRELEWELQHVREQSQQAEQAHTATLQAAQGRASTAEAACLRAEQEAARLKDRADTAHAEAACLAQGLGEAKVDCSSQPCCDWLALHICCMREAWDVHT